MHRGGDTELRRMCVVACTWALHRSTSDRSLTGPSQALTSHARPCLACITITPPSLPRMPDPALHVCVEGGKMRQDEALPTVKWGKMRPSLLVPHEMTPSLPVRHTSLANPTQNENGFDIEYFE